jgi:predicted RNA-binding Zn ribbon-like protein
VNFAYYNSRSIQLAVDLVNTFYTVKSRDALKDEAALRVFLSTHEDILPSTEIDTAAKQQYEIGEQVYRNPHEDWTINAETLAEVHALRGTLRQVFEQASIDERKAATLLNEVLHANGATPRIRWHNGPLHLQFEPDGQGWACWLAVTTAMGLAVVLCNSQANRLGICASATCRSAFIDTSKNMHKRFCSETCAQRESVAAFRARKRAASSTK